MKKHRIQSLCGLAVFGLLLVAVSNISATRSAADEQAGNEKQGSTTKLVGTWTLEKAENPGSPSGIGTRLKMFNGTHWCVVQPDENGEIVFQHGGTYNFDGTTLKEKIDFAGELTTSLIGTTGSFKLKIDGDVLQQIDSKGVFNETWRRVKPVDAK